MFGTKFTKNEAKVFHTLFHLDVLRGQDSSGICFGYDLKNNKKEPLVGVVKEIGTPECLYDAQKEFFTKEKLVFTEDLNLVLGHNRYKTQGEITVDNAHPFEFDKIVGVHNGTVPIYSLSSFKGFRDFTVDSQIIFSHLDHTNNIKEVWENLNGDATLVWYNKQEKTLNMIRNENRPMFYCYSKDGTKIFWASESWMLKVALTRYDVKHEDVLELPINKHFKFNLGEAKIELEVEECKPFLPKKIVYSNHTPILPTKDPIIVSIEKGVESKGNLVGLVCVDELTGEKFYVYVPTIENKRANYYVDNKDVLMFLVKNYYPNSYVQQEHDCKWWAGFSQLTECFEKSTGIRAKGYNNVLLNRDEFENLCKYGCSNCTSPISWETRNRVLWEEWDCPVCEDCVDAGYESYRNTRNNVVNLR